VRLVKIAANTVTVELSMHDCIQVFDSLTHTADDAHGGKRYLAEALANGLLASAYAAFMLAELDPPLTIRHLWEMWAPHDTSAWPTRRSLLPAHLELTKHAGAGPSED